MRFPLALLGMSAQAPFEPAAPAAPNATMRRINPDFKLKEAADVFSPKDMLELPRPAPALVNQAGDLFVVPVSKYSFKEKKNHKTIYISSVGGPALPLEIPLTSGGEIFWIDSRTVGQVVGNEEKDIQELYVISVKFEIESSTSVLSTPEPPKLIGTFPTTPSSAATNFVYRPDAKALVFSAYVYADYDLSTVKDQDAAWEKRGHSGLVYDDTYVRHWDVWQGTKKSGLFAVGLEKKDGEWVLSDKIKAPMKGTGHSAPVEPFGGKDDFDVSDTHILYTTKDPKLPEAWHTKQNVYIVDINGEGSPKELTSGKQGAIHAPVFSTKGDKAAWLELDEDGYEADRAKIVIYDLEKDVRFTVTQKWDRSPDSIAFSTDDKHLYFTAGDVARVKVFALPVPPTPAHSTTHPDLHDKYTSPRELSSAGAASGLQPLADGRLVFSRNSLTTPNDVFLLDPAVKEERKLTDFSSGALEGKSLSDGEEVWWEGAEGRKVQGWIVKPPGFKKGEEKKWPIVMLIHGGPQGAWEDQWSTRWNPNVWTNQGYIAFLPNPTGSTTFGQSFTDAIAEDWGGKPFVDMRKGWAHVLKNYPEADPDRSVAAGASWGGYAINWIQGHPEYEFGFKALICHDGVFDSNYNGYSTDELYFFNHEWGGRPWETKSKALSEKMSPVNYVQKWSTPQLLIHGSKDYRLPETESIGAFHALQQKGIPSRLLVFPDENHWVLNHGNSIKWHYEVFRWLDEFVGKDE